MKNCKTSQDAHERVLQARLGSLPSDATRDYLRALRTTLYAWIANVDIAITKTDASLDEE